MKLARTFRRRLALMICPEILGEIARLQAPPTFAREVTHEPVWSSGRRPNWWSNIELRAFLIETHRQMTIAECLSKIEERFGKGHTSMSGINRIWMKLDQILGRGGEELTQSHKKKEAA